MIWEIVKCYELRHKPLYTHTCTHTQTIVHNLYTRRYLQEYTPLGTAGGLYHFRDQIARTFGSETSSFFVLNSDVCCDFPLQEMIDLHKETTNGTGFVIMGTKVCTLVGFVIATKIIANQILKDSLCV